MEAERPTGEEEGLDKMGTRGDACEVNEEAGVEEAGEDDGGSGGKKTGSLAPSLLALHPSGSPVFATAGAAVRGFDVSSGSAVSFKSSDGTEQAVSHGDAVRAICVDPTGRVMATAGDDKIVNLWVREEQSPSNSWICCHKEKVSKRVSAKGFSNDGRWLLFADKFGVVHALAVPSPTDIAARSGQGGEGKRAVETAKQLLGHCCSIITCLAVSHGNRFIATGDRDGKIRVGVARPLFLTALAFVGEPAPAKHRETDGAVAAADGSQQLLLSAAADGTVRLWDPSDGRCLQVLRMPPPPSSAQAEGPSPMAVDSAGARGGQAEAEAGGTAETEGVVNPEEDAGGSRGGKAGSTADGSSLVAVAVDPSGCLIAGAVAGSPRVCLLRFDPAARTLQIVQCVTLNDGVPATSLSFAPDGKIWTVAGAAESLPSEDSVMTPEAEAAAAATAARIALAAVAPSGGEAEGDSVGMKYQVLADGEVPGGKDLLAALQGSVSEDVAAVAREAAKGAVDGLWGAMKKKDLGEFSLGGSRSGMGCCLSIEEQSVKITKNSTSKSSKSSQPWMSESTDGSGGEQSILASNLRRFTYKELQAATNRFRDESVLGAGSFGKVYRGAMEEWLGELPKGEKRPLAIKMLDEESFQGFGEWMAEVLLLGRLQHPNLVRLLGYSTDRDEAVLVYELLENGSLDSWLFPDDHTGEYKHRPLTWEERVRIALDATQGLAYLHSENVIHRDFKSCNVLLDKDMRAKLTDFGMATMGPESGQTHISTRVMGTMGYLDPKYLETGHLTPKSDIYALGVVYFELLTGRPPSSGGETDDCKLTTWVRAHVAQRRPNLDAVMDERLEDKYSRVGAQKLLVLAKHCINEDPAGRPQMENLIKTLQQLMTLPVGDEGNGAAGGRGGGGAGGELGAPIPPRTPTG
ncbi:unnamed protein product [Closterium sp. Yama58-4]|nr:unnamed protein product [Closterium sp. Yama58-4]